MTSEKRNKIKDSSFIKKKSFFIDLSKHYLELLENSNNFDVVIKIKENNNNNHHHNYKEFKVHSFILNQRSNYFKKLLLNTNNNNNIKEIIFDKQFISPQVFDIILKYIYGGILDIEYKEPEVILDLLIAADELHFNEIIDYLQDIFLKQTQNSIQKYFTHFYDVTSQYSNFTKLRNYIKNIVTDLPHIIFRADDFTGLDKETLLYLVKRVDIVIEEIEIWDCLLKWCMVKTNLKNKDIKDWNIDDFYCFGKSLEPFLPHIKFEYITKEDYFIKIKPFKQSFNQNVYKKIKEAINLNEFI
ncbi:BTB/POZ protein [Glomus cerebriforme]|uniref:BTB/POZ protein n=1 Tax=Glomus cerebriforme TaxID=658196 RepID=A0A397T7H4_9GLOM|nr:BTB/POZ protein [Glomus cerebriforme]